MRFLFLAAPLVLAVASVAQASRADWRPLIVKLRDQKGQSAYFTMTIAIETTNTRARAEFIKRGEELRLKTREQLEKHRYAKLNAPELKGEVTRELQSWIPTLLRDISPREIVVKKLAQRDTPR